MAGSHRCLRCSFRDANRVSVGVVKVTVLTGGVGGARFLRGLRHHLRQLQPDGAGGTTASITAVVNTGDDMWLAGLRISPDLDSVMYTLAEANGLKASEGDIDDKVTEMSTKRGVNPGQLYASLQKAQRLGELERGITEDKVFAWLFEKNTIE